MAKHGKKTSGQKRRVLQERLEPKNETRSKKKSALETTAAFWRKKYAVARDRLAEAEDALDAIRAGEVDALVMNGKNGPKVYSLAGSEEPYRVYIEHMQEGAVTASAEGVILYSNQRFADMCGLALEKVIGSQLQSVLHATGVLKVVDAPDSVMKHETLLQQSGGTALPVHLTASRLPVGDLHVVCLVVTDLTGQREKAQLRVAKEVAEKANEEKDEFLARLSHELRTPLTPTMLAMDELGSNTDLPEKVRRDLAMIRRNIELEARLIDDLLDVTRIARGKLELRIGTGDIHSVVEQALEICRGDFAAKQLRISFIAKAETTAVEADEVRLQQAVWNLLRNAIKFTPGGGTVEIRTGNRDERVFVTVSDSGIGFDAVVGRKLFSAFEQGSREITRKFGGLGLGLAITRSIVEAHHGTVTGVSAGPGRGAAFTLELPVNGKRVHAAALAPAAKPVTAIPAGTLRLLLVEDHKDTRCALDLILKRAGHQVAAAATAQEAMELAARQPFDLVISDLGLPDLSGLEMMTQLRDRFGLTGIAVSGYGMEEDIARSREAGFRHHLTKPISMDALKKLIEETSWSAPVGQGVVSSQP